MTSFLTSSLMKWRNKYKVMIYGVSRVSTPHLSHLVILLWVFLDPEPRIRTLGLAVLRGPTITLLSPVDGLEEISNPFVAQD